MKQRRGRLTTNVINTVKKLKVSELWAPDREEDEMSKGENFVAGGDR